MDIRNLESLGNRPGTDVHFDGMIWHEAPNQSDTDQWAGGLVDVVEVAPNVVLVEAPDERAT